MSQHNTILPFTQTSSFFCHNSILPFIPLPFFSVTILFYNSFFVLNLILFYPSLKTHLFMSFYYTVCTIPTFFCLHPILLLIEPPFECEVVSLWRSVMTHKDKPSSFFVLNLILFYHSLKHLFCQNSNLPFVQLLLFSVSILLSIHSPSFSMINLTVLISYSIYLIQHIHLFSQN